jgi:aminotransferase
MSAKLRPDIRAITRLVPPSGNLVQGQSELAIHPALANAASEVINASQNHYSPAEGVSELRQAVAQKIGLLNGIIVDPKANPLELLITPGATGSLTAIAHTYLKNSSAIVFEPYYPYHRRIIEEFGGRTEVVSLHGVNLDLDEDELRSRCRDLTSRQPYPLRAIIVCTPVNPTGKVFTSQELEMVRRVCEDFDLLCISDEVYEHYVEDANKHISIATLDGMGERTITVNSFSKSWNISGWRLGYVYGDGKLIAPLNNANNIFHVCSPTPLQRALAKTLMANSQYYSNLRERFVHKRVKSAEVLEQLGFQTYDSGSTFYIWARIPKGHTNAMEFNEMLMSRAGVAGVPGSAFAESDEFDNYMRFCIAREDAVLESALTKIRQAIVE